MRPIIFALAVLSAQGIVAWDTGDWSDKWWKQDKAPIKHKHHKHYRHHHHRKQLCEPVVTTTSLTTTTTTTSKPSRPSGIVFIPGGGIPPNIAGDLTSTGADCGNSLTTLAYGRFNAIFFGNFITTEAHEIIGPLAVGGDFSGHAYTINTQHGSDCSDVDNSFGGYALIVGKNDVEYTYSDVHVHGAVFLPKDTNTGNIQQLDGACSVYNDRGVGLMNFKMVHANAITASQEFSLMKPTLHLSSDGTLTRIGSSTTGFDVITFGTCKTCSYGDSFSSPDALYYGIGNWNGPMGMSWPERLIINLPVVHDTTITIQGNQPSLGMRVCSTLLNFYPSDEAGNYREGTFQVDRTTGGRIGGFFLMPEGDIIDENRGAFAGQIIANNYHWLGSGIEIHDYRAAGGNCLTTDICIPVYTNDGFDIPDVPNVVDPESSSDSSSNESSTESSSSSEENSSSESDSSSSEESSSSSSEESSSSSSVESSSEESSSDDSNNSSEESSNEESSNEESSSQESSSNSEESSSQESNNSTENVSSQSRSEEHISSNTESSSDSSDGAATGHDDGTSVDSSSTESSSNGPSSTDDQSSSTTNSQLNSSSESSTANISSTLSESSTSESIPQSSETSSDLESTILSSTISSSTISSSTISSGTISSGTISSGTISSGTITSSSGQSDSQVSSPTDCPTETSTECHTHHHHVTTTQYQCDQGFIHDEEVLVCEHDSHHHHRKDHYAGDDDDNFENDVEFGLYDYNRFDEECDIDHGVVNYDKDEYEYNHYKYKGKKHHDNDDEEEDDEEEDEEDEDDDEDEDEDEDENKDEDEDDDK